MGWERWACRRQLLHIVLRRGSGRWPGTGRSTEAVLCQSITTMVTLACTKPCHFNPTRSLWVFAGSSQMPTKHSGRLILHTVRCTAHVQCPGRCHCRCPTHFAMSRHVPHPWLCYHTCPAAGRCHHTRHQSLSLPSLQAQPAPWSQGWDLGIPG